LAQRQSGEVWVINSERGHVRAGTSRGPIPPLLFFRLDAEKTLQSFHLPALHELNDIARIEGNDGKQTDGQTRLGQAKRQMSERARE